MLKLNLTFRHWRITQVCFALPGPPNLTMSRQKLHSPQSDLLQASHFLHRVRRLRGPLLLLACDDEELLPAWTRSLEGVSEGKGRLDMCMAGCGELARGEQFCAGRDGKLDLDEFPMELGRLLLPLDEPLLLTIERLSGLLASD